MKLLRLLARQRIQLVEISVAGVQGARAMASGTLAVNASQTLYDSKKSPYYDGKGFLRTPDSPFYDGKGILRTSDSPYYDFKGFLRFDKSMFYDKDGMLRSPGGLFKDGKGFFRW